jgi:hypothetical protein
MNVKATHTLRHYDLIGVTKKTLCTLRQWSRTSPRRFYLPRTRTITHYVPCYMVLALTMKNSNSLLEHSPGSSVT